MTTTLKKTVARRTDRSSPDARRPLIVSLEPGDVLSIREQGRRYKVRICLHALYAQLVKAKVRKDEQEKQSRKRKRKGKP